MRAVFLDHSGFLVELPAVTLLFDWWKGELPALRPGIPLLVFSSHRHEDHFKPEIFALNAQAFLLGSDLRLTSRNLEKWGVSEETAARCARLGKHDTVTPLPGVTVETFPSTDEGVAFLVTADGTAVFHAGDLNWWHWAEEGDAWNRNMEANFKRYTEPLRGRRADLAMLPLDPRLESGGDLGPDYFLGLMDVRRFFPMHQWDHFEFTDEFLKRYPQFAPITVKIHHNLETFQLD